MTCQYRWKQHWWSRLINWFTGDRRHFHRCVRVLDHDVDPLTALHRCQCASVTYAMGYLEDE